MFPPKYAMASDFVMVTHHYGDSHMGCPIGFAYGGATVIGMGSDGVGARIRQLRKAKGLTQPVLSKAVGIDQSTLSDIERGAGFSAEILMRLAEELDTTCEYIMRGQIAQTEGMRRARQAIGALSDEERLALFTMIQSDPVPDHEVEARMPATRAKPATTADEVLRRARPSVPNVKKSHKRAA